MKQINGVWLPDEEEEMAKFLRAQVVDGVGVYQFQKLLAALRYVRQFRNAIDIGAHCGLWAMQMEKRFENVYAFEPVLEHQRIFAKNTKKALLYPYALGDKPGRVRLAKGIKSTGDTCIAPEGEYEAELRTLDSFDFQNVDFIKIDCEGYELFVLKGGEKTIKQWHPAIIVEQKPGKAKAYGLGDTEAVKWLEQRNYKLHQVIAGDYILA